jgi:tetratricopeptide (TPR) repeat protein
LHPEKLETAFQGFGCGQKFRVQKKGPQALQDFNYKTMAKRKQVRQVATSSTSRPEEDVLVNIVEVRDQAQSFVAKNRKPLMIFGGLVLALVLGLIGWNLYTSGQQKTAVEQLRVAQRQFERDSFAVALNRPGGGYGGFLQIIDNYPGTKAANLCHYYAGVCYLNLGKYDAAVSYLKDYSPKGDPLLSIMKNGALGDAYSELKDMDKAKSYYAKAAAGAENDLLTPYYLKKLGMLAELQKDYSAALKHYQEIKDRFPNSAEGQDIEKYLVLLEGK